MTWLDRLPGRGRQGILWLLLVMVVAAATVNPEFRTLDNAVNVLNQSAALGILAVGQTVVIIAGLLDLSVGMLIGLIVVLTNDLMNGQASATLPAILLALGLGLAVGTVNGVLDKLLRIDPLILTFGMLSVLQGVIFVYTDRSVGRASDAFLWMASGTVAGVPFSAILLAAASGLVYLLLDRTRFGRHVFAVGGDETCARRDGIDTARIRLIVFMISGLSAGIAGILVAGRLGTGYPNAGAGFELDAIVAVVLGGTSLAGGRGSVLGTVAAVFVLGIASNILNLMEVSSFVQLLVKGLIVVVAIIANQPRRLMPA